jgi:putative sterol carrier protein
MAVYQNADEAKQIFDDLFERIIALEESNQLFSAANAVLGVVYNNPDYFIAIDGTQSPAVLHRESRPVDIEIRMSADTGHTFWKNELNFPVAMMKGKVKIKGPSDVVMKLLPAVLPGQGLYPAVLKDHNRQDLI